MVVLACASQEIHAGEVGHEARAWAGGDLAGESGLDDLALLENDQPVGERDRFEWVMGDEDSNPGEAGELARKLAADLGADANVERRQGLVEQQQPRLRDEGPQQSDALRLASRQLARHDAGFVAQAGAIQPAARDARPIPLQSKRDVLEHRHVREKDVVLKDDADPSLLGTWRPTAESSSTSPSSSTRPAIGTRPASARRRVVLPAPLGPSTATVSPASTVRSMSRLNPPRSTSMTACRLMEPPANDPAGR